MTYATMIDEICGPINYDPTNATHIARALRWLNFACLKMAELYDFPNLVSRNGSFVTIAGEAQDLTATVVSTNGFGTTFLRVLQNTMRIGSDPIPYKHKSWFDRVDPDRTYGGDAQAFSAVGNGLILLWPAPGAGTTVNVDWMARPTTITSATTETGMPFDSEFHEVMVNGSRVRGMRYEGMPQWYQESIIWEKELAKAYSNSHAMHIFYSHINARDFGT